MVRFARLLALSGALVAGTLTASITPSRAATPSEQACGVTPGPSGRFVSTASPCRLVLPVGASVSIRFSIASRYRWSPPVVSSSAVSVTTTRPASGGVTGTVRARAVGVASITMVGRMVCPPGQVCPALAVQWRLRVYVVARAKTPLTLPLTTSDNGTSLTLRRGDRVVLALTGPATYVWTVPVADNPAVLTRLVASAGHATFLAAHAGVATISASDNPKCYPQCLSPSQLFQVRVVVAK